MTSSATPNPFIPYYNGHTYTYKVVRQNGYALNKPIAECGDRGDAQVCADQANALDAFLLLVAAAVYIEACRRLDCDASVEAWKILDHACLESGRDDVRLWAEAIARVESNRARGQLTASYLW